jgi:DNA invertase Pin-like site-specific DNA recombinase
MYSYGYARVSTIGQTLASQDAQLMAAGCAKVYAEKVSGAKTDRPELAKLWRRTGAGDDGAAESPPGAVFLFISSR